MIKGHFFKARVVRPRKPISPTFALSALYFGVALFLQLTHANADNTPQEETYAWYHESDQEATAGEFIGPQKEPTISTVLNRHYNKPLLNISVPVNEFSSQTASEQVFVPWTVANMETPN